jgi:hypothetical protein
MDKNILCIAVMATLLTGCISNKVNHAHTTAVNLSQDMEKFVLLSNTSIELNKALALKEQDHQLGNGLLPKISLSKTDRETTVKYNTFHAYDLIYSNKEVNEAFTKQNQLLVEYFKNLSPILEDKSVDVAGLVKNIDYLNQVIEKNVSEDGQVNGGLNEVEVDLITKTLSSGFKFHQYKVFENAIREQFPIIIEALYWQKVLFNDNADYISGNHLNENFALEYRNIEKNLLNQFNVYDDLRVRGGKPVPTYNLKEIKKFDELTSQPYTYFNYLKPVDYKYEEPSVKSASYIKICEIDKNKQENEFSNFITQNKNNLVEVKDVSQAPPTFQYVFYDVERKYLQSGDQLICELINIVGLMQENKFDDVKLKGLEKYLSNYDELLKYFSNLYLPKKEDE